MGLSAEISWRKDFEERLYRQNFQHYELLRALLDSVDWEEDCQGEGENLADRLWWTFWHQNTRYPETLTAVPFLSEMLTHIVPANQPFLIDYLMNIALGATEWHLEYGFLPACTRGAYMNETLGIELHKAVEEYAVPRFLELVHTSPHTRTRGAALWALGWFPALRENTLPLLQSRVKQDSNVLVRDSAKFALRMLEKAASQPQDLTVEEIGDPSEELMEEHHSLLMRFYAREL